MQKVEEFRLQSVSEVADAFVITQMRLASLSMS